MRLVRKNKQEKREYRLVRKNEQQKRIQEIPQKENLRIPLDMSQDTNAGRTGCGGNSGRGKGGRGKGASATVRGRHQRSVPTKI